MKVRRGIFETNSSSTHSCVISETCKLYDTLQPDSNGVLVVDYGEFGWEQRTYHDAYTKAQYALTLTQYDTREDGRQPHDPKKNLTMFIEVMKEHTGAKEIQIGANQECSPDFYPEGYVDHQSVDDMIDEIFASKESLKNFIFNPESTLETDNDNG